MAVGAVTSRPGLDYFNNCNQNSVNDPLQSKSIVVRLNTHLCTLHNATTLKRQTLVEASANKKWTNTYLVVKRFHLNNGVPDGPENQSSSTAVALWTVVMKRELSQKPVYLPVHLRSPMVMKVGSWPKVQDGKCIGSDVAVPTDDWVIPMRSQASVEIYSLHLVLGLPLGLLPAGRTWNTSLGRQPGGILTRAWTT